MYVGMLIPSMDISRIMVHAKQIEGKKLKHIGIELRRSKPDKGNFSKTRFEIRDKPRFTKRFSNPSPSNYPNPNQDIRTTTKPQGENKSGPIRERTTCARCGKKHRAKCLAGMGV